jgi:type IV fimbrial biogenesis protein FimT
MTSRGFTLIELLVILTISAILVAMAVPSFQAMIQSNRISGAANSMLSSLDLARSEAIRRANNVTVCRSTNADAPVPACSSAAAGGYAADDWAAGWIVFAKTPPNAANATFEAGDEVLYRQTPFQPIAQNRLIIESTMANPQRVSFNLRGLAMGGGFLGTTLFIDYRDTGVAVRTNMARCLVVNSSGRSRVARVVADVCPAA